MVPENVNTAARSVVVVAHPDDECLWLSSALAEAERVVFVFGDQYQRPRSSAARRNAVAALRIPGLLDQRLVDLALPESGAGFMVDWAQPVLTTTGIAITEPAARARYEANFERVKQALLPQLQGFTHVYTHNPWGEYGHTEHIQVHRAVLDLQAELGFTLRFSNYVDQRNWGLALSCAQQPCQVERVARATDVPRARRLMRVYRQNGAWTWTNWHRWPQQEILYSRPAGPPGAQWRSLQGEWLLDVAGLRFWPPPWRAARRSLP